MVSDLDAAIREALEDPEHEDWCDLRDAQMAKDGRDCNCFMGPRTAALVAVLDECDLAEHNSPIEGIEGVHALVRTDGLRRLIAHRLVLAEEVDRG